MGIDRDTVFQLLETLEERLRRLSSLATVSLDEYSSDPGLQDRVERNLEVAIQCCIDIGTHVLASLGEATPESYKEVFVRLGHLGFISPDLSSNLARMAGFRNILVRGYLKLDPQRVHQYLGRLDDLRDFARAVASMLDPE